MKSLSLFALGLTLTIAPFALAAPIQKPKLAPVSRCASDRASVDLMEMFERIPEYCFRYFGSAVSDRKRLLNGEGVIVDDNFIEIPYEGNSDHPIHDQLGKWQMRAFRDSGGKPILVVNSTVDSDSELKPFLHVFRFGKTGSPYRTTAKDWPFKLQSDKVDGRRIYFNYELPDEGNVISSALPESDGYGYSYRWTGRKFVRFVDRNRGDY